MKKTQIVESLPAAAAICKIDIDLVKRAKRLGCPAFKPGNRIDTGELKKWIAENADRLKIAEALSLKDQKTNEEIRKLRIKNDRDEKLVVLKSKGIPIIEQICSQIHVLMEQKLENEYPSVVAGLEPAQARIYGRRLGDSIRAEMQKMSVLWAGL